MPARPIRLPRCDTDPITGECRSPGRECTFFRDEAGLVQVRSRGGELSTVGATDAAAWHIVLGCPQGQEENDFPDLADLDGEADEFVDAWDSLIPRAEYAAVFHKIPRGTRYLTRHASGRYRIFGADGYMALTVQPPVGDSGTAYILVRTPAGGFHLMTDMYTPISARCDRCEPAFHLEAGALTRFADDLSRAHFGSGSAGRPAGFDQFIEDACAYLIGRDRSLHGPQMAMAPSC